MSVAAPPNPNICRHCRKQPINRPKQLCWSCYYTPGVVALYPSTHKATRRGVGNGNVQGRQPEKPTTAPPGSRRKLAVMLQRIKRYETVDHPDDAKDWSHATQEDRDQYECDNGKFPSVKRKQFTADEVDRRYSELEAAQCE